MCRCLFADHSWIAKVLAGDAKAAGDSLPISFAFTDPAFAELTITAGTDNLSSAVTETLVGDVLTINRHF
jgi:hypothetical protein